jgi:hypothetical protein
MCYAQEQERLIIKLTPQHVLHPSIPTFTAGAEFKQFKHWSLSLDLGLQTPSWLFNWNDDLTNVKLWRLRSEIRWYPFSYSRLYVAAQYLQSSKSYNRQNDYYINEANQQITYTSSDVKLVNHGYCILLGKNFQLSRKFWLDFYGGLGQRFSNTAHTNVVDPMISTSVFEEEWNWWDDDRDEGKEKFVYLALGIKVGFVILESKGKE